MNKSNEVVIETMILETIYVRPEHLADTARTISALLGGVQIWDAQVDLYGQKSVCITIPAAIRHNFRNDFIRIVGRIG